MNQILIIIFLFISLTDDLLQCQTKEIRDDLKQYYDQYNVDGSFALYDRNNDKYILYNPSQFTKEYIPASTFKICNSLIGLETGVIKDEEFIIKWDSVVRQIPAWNQDQDMRTAFKNSTVWYYQELARRVGGQQMKYWLDKTGYGNADTSGGIDKFWLTGGLRMTPEKQIEFLKRLHDNELPFSQRSMDIVKDIMIAEGKPGYVLRAKTGWGVQNDQDIGWYVGFMETSDNVYYFCCCIQSSDHENKDFAGARKDIALQILGILNIADSK